MQNTYTYEFKIKNSRTLKVRIAEQDSIITHLLFENSARNLDLSNYKTYESEIIRETAQQLREYFSGARIEFKLPFRANGTPFQEKVWHELTKIPYGATSTYKEIATRIGMPTATRAVGGANNKNPIAIIIPCHRVIGANGKLIGYAGGTNIKQELLALETR